MTVDSAGESGRGLVAGEPAAEVVNLAPVFVCGYMHSGTTLVGKLLRGHPELWSPDTEPKFVSRCRLYERRYDIGTDAGRHGLCSELIIWRGIDEEVRDAVLLRVEEKLARRPGGITPQMLYREVMDGLAVAHGARGWVDRSPNTVDYLVRLFELFPDARLVCIHRDARDVLASKKTRTLTVESGRYEADKLPRKRLEKDWNPVVDALSWRRTVEAGLRAAALHSDRVRVLAYEEVVADPEATARELAAWIGVDFQSSMLDVGNRNAAEVGAAGADGIAKDAVGRWRRVLSSPELRCGVGFTSGLLERLGYSVPAADRPGKIERLWLAVRYSPGFVTRIWKRFRLMRPAELWVFSIGYARRMLGV